MSPRRAANPAARGRLDSRPACLSPGRHGRRQDRPAVEVPAGCPWRVGWGGSTGRVASPARTSPIATRRDWGLAPLPFHRLMVLYPPFLELPVFGAIIFRPGFSPAAGAALASPGWPPWTVPSLARRPSLAPASFAAHGAQVAGRWDVAAVGGAWADEPAGFHTAVYSKSAPF